MLKCPNCKTSEYIGGLMQSFWVLLDPYTDEPVNNWRDWESETELGPERSCLKCGHQFDATTIGGDDGKR